MTREEKIEKKKHRAFVRKAKRIAKDRSYLQTSNNYDRSGLSWGRRKQQGRVFNGCSWSCEERGYCNGDC